MTAFFDDSPGGDAGALAWPGPAGTDRPLVPVAGALEQKLSARWALLEETGLQQDDYLRAIYALPDGERRRVAVVVDHALRGSAWEADDELRRELPGMPPGPVQEMVGEIRRRLAEASAAYRSGDPLRRFDRVVIRHRAGLAGAWDEPGVIEWACNPGATREALAYPDGQHLWPGHWLSVPYQHLTLTARGGDPVTVEEAQRYARAFPPGTRLSEYESNAVATAGRLGQGAGGDPLPDEDRQALATVTRLGQAADGTAIRRAIRHHQERHSNAGGGGTIQFCPSPRCIIARSDWGKLAWQFPPGGAAPGSRARRPPAPQTSAGTGAVTVRRIR